MTMVTLLVIFGLAFGAALYVGKQYRTDIKPVWDPAVSLFAIIRFAGIVLIAYGLWISGRIVLQLIGVLIIALIGLYVAIEKPYIGSESNV